VAGAIFVYAHQPYVNLMVYSQGHHVEQKELFEVGCSVTS